MTSKQKNKVLVIGFFALLLVAYQFSFKRTFELSSRIDQLTEDKSLLENASERIGYLQQENSYLDTVLKSNDVSADQSFEQNLFQKISKLRAEHKVEIVSFEKPHEFVTEGSTLLSYTIEVKGGFRELMFFSSSLEKQRLGKFSSVQFLKKRNPKKRKNELIARIVMQKLSK